MKIELDLSFETVNLDNHYYLYLFENYVKFDKYAFSKNSISQFWNEKKHTKLLKSIKNEDTFGLMSNDYDLFCSNTSGKKGTQLRFVSLIQEKDLFIFSNSEVEKLLNQDSFVVGYLFDEGYAEVQSTPFASNYEERNYPVHILDSIKDTPFRIDAFGYKEYDIQTNPGRIDLIGKCKLMAAYKMWFGKPFFDLVSKERLMSFSDAYEIKELETGKVFVQLFERIEESASPVNMEKQRKWRKWLDFEKLIEKYE